MRSSKTFALLSILFVCLESSAQFMGGVQFDMTGVHLNQMLSQSTRVLAGSHAKMGAAVARPTPKVEGFNTSFNASSAVRSASAVEEFAQTYPAAKQPQARAVFQQLLTSYAQIEEQFRIPKHDVAGAVAAFLAGSYMAYRETGFPDSNFVPLVDQMHSIIAAQPEFQAASDGDKQAMYEQLVILAMFMATTRLAVEKQPNEQVAKQLKDTGRTFLERFLGTDADRVELTETGLKIR